VHTANTRARRYAEGDKVSQSVGFYYMANAGGRLLGTLLSGCIYTYMGGSFSGRGMAWCFLAGAACSLLAVFLFGLVVHECAGGGGALRAGCARGVGPAVRENRSRFISDVV
jgi:hypothetical protein